MIKEYYKSKQTNLLVQFVYVINNVFKSLDKIN